MVTDLHRPVFFREELIRLAFHQHIILDYGTLLALASAADVVVREYLQTQPAVDASVIKLFRTAQQRAFEGWHHLQPFIECRSKGGR